MSSRRGLPPEPEGRQRIDFWLTMLLGLVLVLGVLMAILGGAIWLAVQ